VHALIAARLDTLPPDRKSLLQDASVLGKVFWAGAVAAMGGRDPRDVELALHELARKELVRPARTSSMEGDREFGFWHVLVRDVCYGQITRPGRAARHLAAARWIEEKAGERVEDLADVLAYHYRAALELSEAAGLAEQREELQAQVVRYLTLAGERALSLDVGKAERQLALAFNLCPEDAPQRALLLERLAQATQQLGRLQDARQIFEQALALNRTRGDTVAIGRVLTRLGNVVHRLGDPRCEGLMAEAVELLETQPVGPELVAAVTYAAGRRMFTLQDAEAAAGAERALELAAEVGLPTPAFALHVRGMARIHLGDAGGVDDLCEALRPALEQGLGRETGVIRGNLALATWSYEGPQAGLDATREAIAFNERRGMTELILQSRSFIPVLLAELGQTERALAEAGPLAEEIEAGGDMAWVTVRAVQLRLLAATGAPELAPDPEPLLDAARETGLPDLIADVLGAAAQLRLVQGHPEQARGLLIELGASAAVRSAVETYLLLLPPLLRTMAALGETELARSFEGRLEPRSPVDGHALVSARAQLAEAGGDHNEAARLYADAAERWRAFGNAPECAHARLGQGRCLLALGDAAAEVPLAAARDLFASMGYKPALADTEKLLAETVARTA
jgi:tetratricopeptide (TPR) repeat protein